MADPLLRPPTPGHPLNRPGRRIAAMRTGIRMLGTIAPRTTARVAEALFVKTARPAPRAPEAVWLAEAERFDTRADGQTIAGYAWGEGPTVLLVHGWWSHAGRFAPMGRVLAESGFRVVAFDAPGHGQSTGWRASMPEFAAALRAVADTQGPLHAVVGHSLGGAAALFAMERGVSVTRAVTIAIPVDIMSWLVRFRDTFGVSARVYALMLRNMERRLQLTMTDVDIAGIAQRLAVPGLVIHDVHDPDVPWSEAQGLVEAWPNAELYTTEKLGHRLVLRDPSVIDRVRAFLSEPISPRA